MKESVVREKDTELKSNIKEFNMKLEALKEESKDAAAYILARICQEMLGVLQRYSPVDTNKLRLGWEAKPLTPLRWRFTNETKYLMFIEYGIAYEGHPLSHDPEKRARSLRYLFWKGIFKENDGIIIYTYTPVPAHKRREGFIRKTIKEYSKKAPEMIKKHMLEYIEKKWDKL